MNTLLLIAGILSFLLGAVHSVLGEYKIFNHMRRPGSLVPTKAGPELRGRHVRIIWATWHLASLFGWCIGAVLIALAVEGKPEVYGFIARAIGTAMLLSSLLVGVGTRGRHPGWVVLLVIGALALLGG